MNTDIPEIWMRDLKRSWRDFNIVLKKSGYKELTFKEYIERMPEE